MAKKQVLFFLGLLLVLPLLQISLLAQKDVTFDSISCEQVFSKATITSILQGPKGFIWFGTYNRLGLCRYDGYTCLVYKHDPTNPQSISGNDINCLCLDSENNLWIGTYKKGLNRFDFSTETFTRFTKKDDEPQGLSSNEVTAIYEDKNKKDYLWIGTDEGLNRFDRKKKEFKVYRHDSSDANSLSSDKITSICSDSAGLLWIGTQEGLNQLDREKNAFKQYKKVPGEPGSLGENHIRTIYEDRKKNLWIGTRGGGLYQYIREEDRFVHFPIRQIPPGSIRGSKDEITSIYEDGLGTLWLGTFGSGLYRYSKEKGCLEPYPNHTGTSPNLTSTMINTIYEDKTGLLWIGTEGGGINTYNRRKKNFSHFTHCPRNENSLSYNTVLSICEEPERPGEIIWVGTYFGLNRFNRRKNRFTHFKHNPDDPGSISGDSIRYILIDSYGACWVATNKGLNQLNRETFQFTSFKNEPGNPASISSDDVGPIYEDKKRQLWIGTNQGLNLFDRKTKSFENFENEDDNLKILSTSNILCLREQIIAGENVLWIGTFNNGLIKFNREKRELEHYNANPNIAGNLSSNNVRSIYEDKEGILWLGTDEGLNRFDSSNTWNFFVYSETHGLPSNVVYGILEDESAHLWISTHNGLCRFDKKTKEVKKFYEGNGVPIRVFNMDAYHKNSSGEMFFGGMNGFVSFFPEKIETNHHSPKVVITAFKLFNKPVAITIGGKLEKSITETKEIQLTYEENMFSFEFAALDYTWPGNNRYKYMLVRFDKDWNDTDARNRHAQYMNLNHGTYTFKVKGSNNDGVWSQEEASIKIIITPPFWKEWWFRVAVGLGIVLLLVILYLLRTRRFRKKLAEQQRVQEILKQSRDIMEQARDLAEFRRAEIERLITAISSLLIAVNAEGKIFQWNETAEKCFNIPASQTNDQLFVEVLKDYISMDLLNMMMEKGLGSDNLYDNFEIPIQPKNTASKLLLGVINPIMDKKGKKLGFLLLAEDITHRKEEEMRRNLSQKLESLGKMVRSIAHEIKSPLQYIGNNSYFICDSFEDLEKFFADLNQSLTNLDNSDPAQIKENIAKILQAYDIEYILEEVPRASDQIVKGVSRVSTIIQSMLDYTHPGKNVMEQANIHELLETTLVLIRSNKKEFYELERRFSEDIPPVLCYPGELVQVFMNLLTNAVDAIKEKGEPGLVKITTSIKDNEVIVAIADTGCGIADDIRDNIYNPFFTTKDVGKGTGQGLALVHNIVTQRHKGKIYFESQVGEGTTFYVHLPLSPDDM